MKKIFLFILILTNPILFGQNNSIDIVYKLFEVTNVEAMMQQMVDEMIGVQIRSNPNLADYKDVMREFLNKKLDYNIIKEELATIYTNEFSKSELQKLIEFYETDLGKKTIIKMPIIMQKSMMVGERAVSSYLPELESMLNDKKKQLLKENFNSTNFNSFFSNDSTFELSIPDNWDRSLELLEGASFQAGNINNEMYLIVMTEDISDSSNYDLDSKTSELMQKFSSKDENFKVLDSIFVKINDLPQNQVAFEYNNGNAELTYYLVTIKGNGNAYIILGWTLKELFDYNKEYFYKVVSTFKEHK